jgi:ferrous iron transport protein B
MEKNKLASKAEEILSAANAVRWDLGVDYHDVIIESIYEDASRIAKKNSEANGRQGSL